MYSVTLAHATNPDIDGCGYWNGYSPEEGSRIVCAATLEHAAALCRRYIIRNELGGGNWIGGEVRDAVSGELVATVSYNGRIWPVEVAA